MIVEEQRPYPQRNVRIRLKPAEKEDNGTEMHITLKKMLLTNQPDSNLINLGIEQLYDSALIQEGLHPNPADILPCIQQLLTLAAAQADQP